MLDRDPPTDMPGSDLAGLGTFRVRSERDGDAFTIVPTGELDMATAPLLEAALLQVEASDAPRLVVDLSELTFIDSTGVRLLVRTVARTRPGSERIELLRPTAGTLRVFELCGLADRMPFTN